MFQAKLETNSRAAGHMSVVQYLRGKKQRYRTKSMKGHRFCTASRYCADNLGAKKRT